MQAYDLRQKENQRTPPQSGPQFFVQLSTHHLALHCVCLTLTQSKVEGEGDSGWRQSTVSTSGRDGLHKKKAMFFCF